LSHSTYCSDAGLLGRYHQRALITSLDFVFPFFPPSQFLPLENPCNLPQRKPFSVYPFLPGPRLTSFVCRKWQTLTVWKTANLVSHLHTDINSCQNRASLQGEFRKLSVSRLRTCHGHVAHQLVPILAAVVHGHSQGKLVQGLPAVQPVGDVWWPRTCHHWRRRGKAHETFQERRCLRDSSTQTSCTSDMGEGQRVHTPSTAGSVQTASLWVPHLFSDFSGQRRLN